MLNQCPHYAPAALALFTTPRLHVTHSLCSRCSPFSHTSATSHPFRIVFVFKCHSINLIQSPNHESRVPRPVHCSNTHCFMSFFQLQSSIYCVCSDGLIFSSKNFSASVTFWKIFFSPLKVRMRVAG